MPDLNNSTDFVLPYIKNCSKKIYVFRSIIVLHLVEIVETMVYSNVFILCFFSYKYNSTIG